ncbi:MAG TPA: alpha-L-fucosidase [Gemmatimonadaceae bacterium]|nr:alpha-L-fucosidase [Gemmatimonadaceae bacterium]
MSPSRRDFLRSAAAAGLSVPLARCRLPSRPSASAGAAPFAATWESLSRYEAPAWFRDAKFGIWSHWGPQCVPEQGDWYARRMYIQGEPQYAHHLRTRGHPSKTGFLDVIGEWKAERWDPEALMRLYARAGAKYFVSMANHHDNFDNYDSKHHGWNSVRVGPKRDIVGTWAKVARAHGLRFGVSNHSAHAWHWFQTAYDYDPEGPLAGVRYDAARLTRADGRGTWWDGLDPRDLYGKPAIVMADGFTSARAAQDWHWQHDGAWTEEPPPGDPEFARRWLLRCQDLVDSYRPDFLYFDDTELPLGQAGLDATAYFYNANAAWHGGRLESVVTAKKLAPAHATAVVEDVERGFSDTLRPLPWHADTCLGDWHYDRSLYERHGYKTAETVIARLCDTVAKNGSLLLSVPMRGDGTIDDDETAILERIAGWMAVNGEAIFGTRPWKAYGEGPTPVGAGTFGEEKARPFTARDLRFTTKGDTLYAILLGRLETATVTITSLATDAPHAPGRVESVRLLGASGPLAFRRDTRALTVTLPERLPERAVPLVVLAIEGRGIV